MDEFNGMLDLISKVEDPLGEWNGNPLQYSCLEHPMDRGAWWATLHEAARVPQDLTLYCCCLVTKSEETSTTKHGEIEKWVGVQDLRHSGYNE